MSKMTESELKSSHAADAFRYLALGLLPAAKALAPLAYDSRGIV